MRRFCGERLQQLQHVKAQANHRPGRNRQQAPIGPCNDREERQQYEVGVSPRCDLAEERIDRAPDVNLKAQPFDGNAFNHALQYVAAKNGRHHAPEGFIAPLGSGGQQAIAPGNIPERRVDEIDAVIEIVAPFAGGQRSAGKLAIHGVEKSHGPGGEEAGNELALQEKPERQDCHEGSDCRHHVGCHAKWRQKARGVEGRHGPQVLGDESVAPL